MNRRLSRLFISNVSSKGDLRELERLFSKHGRLENFEISGSSGYLEYNNPEDASEAIKELNGAKFSGKKLEVEYAVKSTNQYVKRKKEQYDSDKSNIKCFGCGEKGHIQQKCPKKRRSYSTSSSKSSVDRKKNSDRKKKRSPSRSRSRSRSKSNDSSRSYSN